MNKENPMKITSLESSYFNATSVYFPSQYHQKNYNLFCNINLVKNVEKLEKDEFFDFGWIDTTLCDANHFMMYLEREGERWEYLLHTTDNTKNELIKYKKFDTGRSCRKYGNGSKKIHGR